MMMMSDNTRQGAYEIPSRALAEWLWRTQTWPRIRREAERAREGKETR